MTRKVGLAAVAALAAMMGVAQAGEGVRGKQGGDIVVGLGAVGVLPGGGGHVDAVGGRPQASDSASPQLDLTYFMVPNVALNLIAASTRHDIGVRGSALGDLNLGHVWVLPPTLTLQLHPFPQSRISPYVGAGINVSFFYGEGGSRTAPVRRVVVDTAPGFAFNAGLDYEVSSHWLANIDVKKLILRPEASVNSGLVHARVNLDPWVVGASVRYRF